MKKLILFFCATLLFGSCSKKESDCIDPAVIDEQLACSLEYAPVYGCDGKTYPNPCTAKYQHGVKQFTPGACSCSYPYSGRVVDMTGLDGCQLMIELNNGERLEPAVLPANYQLKAGTEVELDYQQLSQASYCMAGKVVEITCIRDLGCLPLDSSGYYTNYKDPVSISKAQINADCLELEFSYGGGCAPHDFKLSQLPLFCGTPPVPPMVLEFVHNANGDMCEALLTKKLSYDLSSIQHPDSTSLKFYLRNKSGTYNQLFVYQY